jgi:hypothetical protein
VFAVLFRKGLEDIFLNVLPRETSAIDLKLQREAVALAHAWFEGPQEQERVKQKLAKYGLDPEAVIGQVYMVRSDKLEKLHRLLAVAESRRTGVVRNFNEYRALSSLLNNPAVAPQEVALVPDSA